MLGKHYFPKTESRGTKRTASVNQANIINIIKFEGQCSLIIIELVTAIICTKI